jgi:rare lipoprotein A
MASGAPFDPSAAVVAHRTLPLGTKLKLQDPASGRTAMATVADRGPYVAGRDLDLSQSLARTLGVEARGVASLQVWVVTDLLDRRWRDEKSRTLMP